MKQLKVVFSLLLVALLLAGCGTKAPAELQQPGEKPVPEPPGTEADPVVTVPTLP